jgi:hypothetical protein
MLNTLGYERLIYIYIYMLLYVLYVNINSYHYSIQYLTFRSVDKALTFYIKYFN